LIDDSVLITKVIDNSQTFTEVKTTVYANMYTQRITITYINVNF